MAILSKKHRLFESESHFVQLPCDLDMTYEYSDVDTIEFWKWLNFFFYPDKNILKWTRPYFFAKSFPIYVESRCNYF